MKPEDLLNPETLPDDLQWIVTQHRLHPEDPVFLLIAWHWNRMKACEDTVRLAITELKAAVDGRVAAVVAAAETVSGVTEALDAVQAGLEAKPEELAKQLDRELQKPVEAAMNRLRELEAALGPVAANFRVARRRQLLAVLLIGFTLGTLSAIIAVLP